jgi:hypothetical protein
MTKVTYDSTNRALHIQLRDDVEPIADETIESILTLGWGSNGEVIDVNILGVDPPDTEVLGA